MPYVWLKWPVHCNWTPLLCIFHHKYYLNTIFSAVVLGPHSSDNCFLSYFPFLLFITAANRAESEKSGAQRIRYLLKTELLETWSPKSKMRFSTLQHHYYMPNRCSKFEFQKLQPTVLWRRLIPSPIFLSPSQSNKNIMMSSFSTELHNNPRCSTWHSSVSWC